MKKIIALLCLIPLLQGCHQHNQNERDKSEANQKQILSVFTNAADFIIGLKNDGQLPGVTSSEHGRIIFKKKPEVLQDGSISLTCSLKLTNDTGFYDYTFLQKSTNSPWQLQKAWKSDASGKVIEEYPIN